MIGPLGTEPNGDIDGSHERSSSMDVVDTGTTAFMLCCIIGLTLMIPGLALFYGGMVSVKSSTNMMMMTFGACAIVGVLWVLFGFSMTFGTSYGGFLGSITEFAGMK